MTKEAGFTASWFSRDDIPEEHWDIKKHMGAHFEGKPWFKYTKFIPRSQAETMQEIHFPAGYELQMVQVEWEQGDD